MYPNPANGDFRIEFNDAGRNHTVSILDFTGRKIRSYEDAGNNYLQIEKDDMQRQRRRCVFGVCCVNVCVVYVRVNLC